MLTRSHGKLYPTFVANCVRVFVFVLALMSFRLAARAQAPDVSKKLEGFDPYIEQTLKDWNAPGVGVGIVVNDKLVFAKGYGYLDYEKKLLRDKLLSGRVYAGTVRFVSAAQPFLIGTERDTTGRFLYD